MMTQRSREVNITFNGSFHTETSLRLKSPEQISQTRLILKSADFFFLLRHFYFKQKKDETSF